jgi:putative salt-induced outer membrane protein
VRRSKLDSGESDDEMILHGAGRLVWKLSESGKFSEELTTDIGEDVTISKSVSALTAKLNSKLATRLSYTIKYTSDVAPGLEHTDTETAVTLVYDF